MLIAGQSLLMIIVGKLFGFDLWKLRLLSALVTWFAANLFYSLCKKQNLPYPLLCALFFLFFPYVFFHGFTIYPQNFGLLFAIWALHYYLIEDGSLKDTVKGSILATLAIYSRQTYLILPAGVLLAELIQIPWNQFAKTIRQRITKWVIMGSPILFILPLFILWGGYTTPKHQAAQGGDQFIKFVIEHFNFLPVLIGFYFLPRLLSPATQNLFKSHKKILLTLLALIPIFFLFTPVYSEEVDKVAALTGIIGHGTDLVASRLGANVGSILLFLIWGVGILILLAECVSRNRDSTRTILLAILAAFMGLIFFMPYVAERYYTPIIPILILLLYRFYRNRKLLLIWLAMQILLSVGFSFWQITLKSFELWNF